MPYGYWGKILTVNLTEGTIQERRLEDKLYRDFLGGAGLGARLLLEGQPGGVDPLGPGNILGLMAGLLGGTPASSGSRLTVVSKSPLTGGWGDANVGGSMAWEIKRAGYDGVLFQGISPKPVYMLLTEDRCELKDASHLWGYGAHGTGFKIVTDIPGRRPSVLCIGPAGEAGSLISSIIAETERAAGRSGLGAVMGAKRLKAVVVRGDKKVPVADEERLEKARKKFLESYKDQSLMKALMNAGTAGLTDPLLKMGATPIKNWTRIGAENLPPGAPQFGPAVNQFRVGKSTCANCPVACRGVLEVEGVRYSRPEYETIAAFGPVCFNNDIQAIIRANEICNDYGLDTISTGTVVAFALECYERGYIDKEDTGGLELEWGDAEAMISLLEKIARREGFGSVLADGVRAAGERLGGAAAESAMHVGGQEPGYHDPRLFPARGTGYISDATPGRHTSFTGVVSMEQGNSLAPYPEFAPPKVELRDYEHKAPLYGMASSYEMAFSATGMCKFVTLSGRAPILDYVSAVTGWDFTAEEMRRAGERIQTLRQMFNLREGITPDQVRLPDRLSRPAATGPFKDVPVDFDVLRRQYHQAMGWDAETGRPNQSRLEELGIADL